MSKAREAAMITTAFIEFTRGVLHKLAEQDVSDETTNSTLVTILRSSQLGFVTMVGLAEVDEALAEADLDL